MTHAMGSILPAKKGEKEKFFFHHTQIILEWEVCVCVCNDNNDFQQKQRKK